MLLGDYYMSGKSIVITGASSGIGKAIAQSVATEGWKVFLIGRNEVRLEQVRDEVQKRGATAFIGIGDVGKERDVETLYENAMRSMGKIDILVANAGVGYFGDLETLTFQQYDDQFSTNVKGVFLWLRKVLPQMRERNAGQIIVTSSNLGLETSPRASIYAATKHAVQAMVGSLRKELSDEEFEQKVKETFGI